MNAPTQYAVLRHRRDWPTVVLDRVVVDDDGGLGLARLPGRRPGVTLEGPFEVIPSGLAVDRGQRYLTRADGVLIVFDGICDRRWEKRLTGTPRGLAVDEHDVFIALEAASAIAVLRRDGLELRGDHRGVEGVGARVGDQVHAGEPLRGASVEAGRAAGRGLDDRRRAHDRLAHAQA
ncbi:MAG: hypothetical protein KC731_38690, partial [Myxococcales bacterium]|nr:hypothetical protein [Myxococcales bacterium]